jgi:glycosyltransferase involved in cell wall biosynthesis
MTVQPRTIDVVIPIHRGELTLPALVAELEGLVGPRETAAGRAFVLRDVILVHDRGPDRSDEVLAGLEATHPWIRTVRLGRNSGQHPATLAGVATSTAEWVVTMDEDGLHDPADVPRLLDAAIDGRVHVVYGRGANAEPHSAARRLASRLAKRVYRSSLSPGAPRFTSYRLVLGEVFRTVAVTASHGVYLDAALTWVTDRVAEVPVRLRDEGRPADGYTFRRLRAHFGRLVLSSGPGPLRYVAGLGAVTALGGLGMVAWVVRQRMTGSITVPGWASQMAALLLVGGALLVAVSVVAAYLAVLVTSALGRPLYTVVTDDATVFR